MMRVIQACASSDRFQNGQYVTCRRWAEITKVPLELLRRWHETQKIKQILFHIDGRPYRFRFCNKNDIKRGLQQNKLVLSVLCLEEQFLPNRTELIQVLSANFCFSASLLGMFYKIPYGHIVYDMYEDVVRFPYIGAFRVLPVHEASCCLTGPTGASKS